MKFIFIAGINRSGGSLLARLFDGHPKIASYPMEVAYPFCDNSFKFLEKLTAHQPIFQILDWNRSDKYFNIEKKKYFINSVRN